MVIWASTKVQIQWVILKECVHHNIAFDIFLIYGVKKPWVIIKVIDIWYLTWCPEKLNVLILWCFSLLRVTKTGCLHFVLFFCCNRCQEDLNWSRPCQCQWIIFSNASCSNIWSIQNDQRGRREIDQTEGKGKFESKLCRIMLMALANIYSMRDMCLHLALKD